MTMDALVLAVRVSSGIVVWALHFALVYGATALACARGLATIVPWAIAIATVASAALCIAIAVREWRERARFESWLAASVAAFALVAIVWEAFAALVMPPCV